MKLSRLGEQRLIQHIRKRFSLKAKHLIGMGDDAAVLKSAVFTIKGERDLLWTTDVLVDGVDFDLRHYPLYYQVGYKALAANLSDIAAMGGIPRFYLVTLGLPGDTSLVQVDDLYQGMADLAQEYHVMLLGGDISATKGAMFVGITVLGEVEKGRAVARSGARAGDLLFVTGTLGDAAAGLELLRDRSLRQRMSLSLLFNKQFFPVPRIEAGRTFSRHRIASAMIDLSDGLASDLRHLCEESRVGAVVEAQSLPMSDALMEYARRKGKNPLGYALTGGEDFELLITVPGKKANRLRRLSQEGIKLTRIGRIVPRSSGIQLRNSRGKRIPFPKHGYEHFKS